jgi:hypothetical protein
MALVVVGIVGTPGPAPGSLEGMIYTRIPLWVQFRGLPEVLLQTLAFSWLLCHWVDHPEKRWLSWCLGMAFVVVCLLPAVGLLARPPGGNGYGGRSVLPVSRTRVGVVGPERAWGSYVATAMPLAVDQDELPSPVHGARLLRGE